LRRFDFFQFSHGGFRVVLVDPQLDHRPCRPEAHGREFLRIKQFFGYAARKLSQYAAREVSHLRGRYSTPVDHH
jgi:hypothetical protein